MDKIRLIGFAVTRIVSADGEYFEMPAIFGKPTPSQFNWGYTGAAPAHLAYAILNRYKTDIDVDEAYELFQSSIIASLPSDSFDVRVDIHKWVDDYREGEIFDSRTYMEVNIGTDDAVWIPKYLDFPYLKFKIGVFDENTIEHKLLSKLSNRDNPLFRAYLKKRGSHIDEKGNKVFIDYRLDIKQNVYFVEHGLGSGFNYGTQITKGLHNKKRLIEDERCD